MEEIKQEILSLSEKYSVKCVESAALEEQLALVNKQLAQAQQHILDLDARCCIYFMFAVCLIITVYRFYFLLRHFYFAEISS